MGNVENYKNLVADCKIHLKQSLLNILHNSNNNYEVVNEFPSDPEELYTFLQEKQNRIMRTGKVNDSQKAILFPTGAISVDSTSFDETLLALLIKTVCRPFNQTKILFERATKLRNRIVHAVIKELDVDEYKALRRELKEILDGLKYEGDVRDLLDHLEAYKDKVTRNLGKEFYIPRLFLDGNNIVDENKVNEIIEREDQVIIYGRAGLGKTTTAERLKYDWCIENLLKSFYLMYFNSKHINQMIKYNAHKAPFHFSEIGAGNSSENFECLDAVTKPNEKLLIIVDGIDEFPIEHHLNKEENYVHRLHNKVKENEKISGADTIIAIYFGFLFPKSKVVLFGRIGEFESLKRVNKDEEGTIFSSKRKDLKLNKFYEDDIKKFTCYKFCCYQQSGQVICTGYCNKIYEEKIKGIELCENPTDLNSWCELLKTHPGKNIGRITRTKLIIATLFKRLNEHIFKKTNLICKNFCQLSKEVDFQEYLKYFSTLGEISFNAVLKGGVTVEDVTEVEVDGSVYLEDRQKVRIEKKILQNLDLFYVKYLDNDKFRLEPYHTLNIEFFCACYLFLKPEKWDSILELNEDRQLTIISFIAGLQADDDYTKVFVEFVLECKPKPIEKFFKWLYGVEDLKNSLPNGSGGYRFWFGLMQSQKLSPSFYLLDCISREVQIPLNFIPKTILCNSDFCEIKTSSLEWFEWYDMKFFKYNLYLEDHDSDKLNIESFLERFPEYNVIIKGKMYIYSQDEFNLFNKFNEHKRADFRIHTLYIRTPLECTIKSFLDINVLHIDIGRDCDSHTKDILLSAISTTTCNASPLIKCKGLRIDCVDRFDLQQIKKLLSICSSNMHFIGLKGCFFKSKQLEILKDVERKSINNLINLQLFYADFDRIFDLPNLGNRHISLESVSNVNDDNLTKFKQYLKPSSHHNFHNYKMISLYKPFVRQESYLHEGEQSMYLKLEGVDLRPVSPEVFANVFSSIPTLEILDDEYIPSSHWRNLAQKEDCQITEMRIWRPQTKNLKNFLKIRTKVVQFIFDFLLKDFAKKLLHYIVNNPDIQSDKEIKVFVVKYDRYGWNKYEEIPVFKRKTVADYQKNHKSDIILLDTIPATFHEGEQLDKYWCCEISLPPHENTDTCVVSSSRDNEISTLRRKGIQFMSSMIRRKR